MQRLLSGLLLALLLPLAVLADNPDYEKGKQAFLDGNYQQAMQILHPLAESGHSQAQVTVGIMYDNGNGVPVDQEEAFRWYMKAAEQGFPIVQHQVAFKYLHGIGVEKNYEEAARWWELSANAGLADSQFNLALMLYRGLGSAQDLDRARELFTAAARQGHGHAQYSLAVMYAFGQGVEKNYEQAIKWFHKAAVQDVAQAQYNLGVFYENGFGVRADTEAARGWYEKAANQGLQQARDKLADLDLPATDSEATGTVLDETIMDQPTAGEAPIPAPEMGTTAADTSTGGIRTEHWVLQQPADKYTLQIGSSIDEQGIIDFIRENNLTDHAAYIEVVINGVTRYSALYGIYDSFDEAQQAIPELAAGLQKAGPWVRNFGILQGLIHQSGP